MPTVPTRKEVPALFRVGVRPPGPRYNHRVKLEQLPGGDLVRQGLIDLAASGETVPALLVSIGAPRLRRLGVAVPEATLPDPEHRLYRLLAQEDPDSAHSRYNALIRRLVSFERCAV